MIILTKDELERLHFCTTKEGVIQLVLDVHELKVKKAKQLISNIINVIMDAFRLYVIHGYHGGTAIREMIRHNMNLPRIESIVPAEGNNEGATVLYIKTSLA